MQWLGYVVLGLILGGIPRGTSNAAVDALLQEKREWVERKLTASREIAARPARLALEQPGAIWLGGKRVPIERREGARPVATLDGGRLIVGGSNVEVAGALERWYRREARRRVEAVAARETERLGLSFESIAIRDPRTRPGVVFAAKEPIILLASCRSASGSARVRRPARAVPPTRAEPPEALLAIAPERATGMAGTGALAA